MQPSVTAATPTAVQAPTSDQTPTTAQTPTTGQAPTPGQTPTAGQTSTAGQTPTAGQNPTAGQTPNAGVRTSRLGGYRVFESQFTNATSSSRTPQMRKSKFLFHLIIFFIVAYEDQCKVKNIYSTVTPKYRMLSLSKYSERGNVFSYHFMYMLYRFFSNR